MTDRTARRRLERAGYVSVRVGSVEGWAPLKFGIRILGQLEAHNADVERICAEPPKPRGRPRKQEIQK